MNFQLNTKIGFYDKSHQLIETDFVHLENKTCTKQKYIKGYGVFPLQKEEIRIVCAFINDEHMYAIEFENQMWLIETKKSLGLHLMELHCVKYHALKACLNLEDSLAKAILEGTTIAHNITININKQQKNIDAILVQFTLKAVFENIDQKDEQANKEMSQFKKELETILKNKCWSLLKPLEISSTEYAYHLTAHMQLFQIKQIGNVKIKDTQEDT